MNRICSYEINDYIRKLTEFHGNFAPGLLMGGFMVDIAAKNVKQYEFFDAICETSSCLPDAVQMLTPCTVGNGWLKIIDTGRFAISFYDKKSGNGVRVFLDVSKLDGYPEIKNWFLRLKTKQEQDTDKLIKEIISAGHSIYSISDITVAEELLGKPPRTPIVICASCGEAFPGSEGGICSACLGATLYQKNNRKLAK